MQVYPVRGVVSFEGKPMTGGGAISLVPVASHNGKNAGGIINADGTFVLTTYEDGDGAMTGSFRVIINHTTSQEPDYGGDSDTPGAASMQGEQTVPSEDVIPTIYSDPVSGSLSDLLPPRNRFDFIVRQLREVAFPRFSALRHFADRFFSF